MKKVSLLGKVSFGIEEVSFYLKDFNAYLKSYSSV
jgi:hypothetical protein